MNEDIVNELYVSLALEGGYWGDNIPVVSIPACDTYPNGAEWVGPFERPVRRMMDIQFYPNATIDCGNGMTITCRHAKRPQQSWEWVLTKNA